jgi:hypothetical protein
MAKDYVKRKTNLSSSRSHQSRHTKKWINKLILLFMLLIIIAAIFIWLIHGAQNKKYVKYLPVFLSHKTEAHTKTQPILSSKSAKKITQNDIESPVRFDFYTELSHNQVVLSKSAPIKQVDELSTTRQLQLSKLSMLLDDEYHKKANNK